MATTLRINTKHTDISRISSAWIALGLLVAAVSICTANAVASSTAASFDQKTSSLGTSTQSAPATPHQGGRSKDDIYIDDDALEGSGGHGGHRDDLDREPDYSGSGLGPDDEDSVTHSRTNFRSNKNNLNGQSQGKNNKNQSGGFAGSGDGHIESIRSENDDDEDHRFGVHHAALPTTKPAEKTPKVTTDDDLEIDEDKPEDIEDVDEGLDEDEDEEDEEDEDALNENEDDLGIHKTGHNDLGNTPKENPTALPPTDDEDFEIETKEEDTVHRGLDPYPEDKDANRQGGSAGAPEKGNEVLIMNAKNDDRTTSFFSQPGILAAVIGGAVVGLLCAILVVMFIVYRMRKKDEGSYALDEPKRSPAVNSYAKNTNNREFYA